MKAIFNLSQKLGSVQIARAVQSPLKFGVPLSVAVNIQAEFVGFLPPLACVAYASRS